MGDRTPYSISEDEIKKLISLFISAGEAKTYNITKSNLFFSINTFDDLDEKILDMSDSFLELGREEKKKSNEDLILSKTYYSLSYILRKIAHEIYRKYIRSGKERDNKRFLRLVSNMPN